MSLTKKDIDYINKISSSIEGSEKKSTGFNIVTSLSDSFNSMSEADEVRNESYESAPVFNNSPTILDSENTSYDEELLDFNRDDNEVNIVSINNSKKNNTTVPDAHSYTVKDLVESLNEVHNMDNLIYININGVRANISSINIDDDNHTVDILADF